MPTPGGSSTILIIGAGISGLLLAQACRKHNLPYRIFDRDTSATHRSAGWGLTLNWALPTFKSLLPEDILQRLPETYVNLDAVNAGEKGNSTFFDLSTGEARWKVPASERIRVSRERLRGLMLEGLEVEFERRVVGVRKVEGGVVALFDDGVEVRGCFVVGCDGANSVVRRVCHPQDFENVRLPVRFLGTGVHYSEDAVEGMRKLDPYFLQGSDPRTDVFLWFSFLNTPTDPDAGEGRDGKYYCQVMTSWPYRAGFFGRDEPTEMPDTKEEQLQWMKMMAKTWAEPFRSIVLNIPNDCEILPIHLADWLPRRSIGFDGRVALVGDSAHAMVMYRGEGANHAIVDVANLLEVVQPLLLQGCEDDEEWKVAVEKYEAEMIERTEVAVLASRQACLDAHDFRRLDDNSPLVRRRLMRADLEGRS